MFGVMNMDMKLTAIPPAMEEAIKKHPDAFYNTLYPECEYLDMRSRASVNRAIPFFFFFCMVAGDYGYTTGEWETRRIQIRTGEKQGEVNFYLHVEEDNGIEAAEADIRGAAQLKDNRFRNKKKDHEFEVSIYNGFVVIQTLAGPSSNPSNKQGAKIDGVYPAQMKMSYYDYTEYAEVEPFDAGDPVREQIRRDILALPEMGFQNASAVFIVGPSDEQPYYIFKGGENMETHLAEYFRFHVYVEPAYEIKVYDFSAGEISLEAWRSQRKETFINTEIAGKWVRTEDKTDDPSAEIIITDVTPENFVFSFSGIFINAYGAAHIGELEEKTAHFTATDTALFEYQDEDDSGETVTVNFVFKEDKLFVTGTDNYHLLDFGQGVRMDGEYVRKDNKDKD
jgi:hypothetical protein